MIKTNTYYATVYGRTNNFRKGLLAFIFSISSYPRLCIEIFIRRDMGRDYMSLSYAIRMAVILFLLPFLAPGHHGDWQHVLRDQWGWYFFLVFFGAYSWRRHKECKKPYGYIDFNHFSKSSGKRLPWVEGFKRQSSDGSTCMRTIDVYIEPMLATAVGLVAFLFGQWMLGMLLVICAGIYSLSYMAAYEMGRVIIQERINETIVNGWFTNMFHNDKPSSGSGNFTFYGPKPTSPDARMGIANLFSPDDDGTEVA